MEGATVVEGRKDARGIDGRARDHLHQRHAEQQEFRQHMRQVDHALGAPLRRPVGRDGIGHKALLHGALRDLPGDVPDAPVAEIAPDAAATDRQDLRQHATSVVEHTIGRGRIHVGDDVAALEKGENGAQRRIVLPHMDHDREVERRGRLLRAPQRLEVIGAGDVVRQARLDAHDDIAIARDRALRQGDIGAVDIMQLALGRDDAGPGDVHQDAADLRRATRDGSDLIDIVGAAGAGVDPAGDAILQAHRRPFLASAGMGVNVDQARRDDLSARIDRLGGVTRDICRDRRDFALHNRHVAHGIEPHGGIDDAPALDHQIIGGGAGPAHTAEQRGACGAGGDKLASVHHRLRPPDASRVFPIKLRSRL